MGCTWKGSVWDGQRTCCGRNKKGQEGILGLNDVARSLDLFLLTLWVVHPAYVINLKKNFLKHIYMFVCIYI